MGTSFKTCKKLNIEIRGAHFHVGSGIFGSPNQEQVFDARKLFDLAEEIGYKCVSISCQPFFSNSFSKRIFCGKKKIIFRNLSEKSFKKSVFDF